MPICVTINVCGCVCVRFFCDIYHPNSLSFVHRVVVGFIQGFADPRSDIHNHHSHLYYHGSSLRAGSRHTICQRFTSQDCRSADLEVAELSVLIAPW